MFAGIAGGLLVFTGFWRATEWLMDGRRQDTWMLVPVGLVYMSLGALIVISVGGLITQIVALLAGLAGGAGAYIRRHDFTIRKWVIWTFIVIDVLIVISLIIAMLST